MCEDDFDRMLDNFCFFMMIKCLAIDDEPLALRQLAAYLGKVPYFELVGTCQSAIEAIGVLEKQPVDVLFIDINMPDLNGLDFVRSLQSPPMIVFTTAYQEYAIEGFKVDAIDYLLKPFGMNDIMRAADRVKRRYDLIHSAASASSADDEALFLKMEHKVVRVPLSDIVYIQGMAEYLRIHLHGSSRPLVVLYAMKRMEERLDAADFMRVHKSYIISLNHISEINKCRIVLDTQVEIPIGDSYRERLNDYVRSRFSK